jgi:hypothetical protein
VISVVMSYRLLYLLVSTSIYFLWESWDSCYSSTLIEHCQNVSIYCVMVFMNKAKNKQQTWFNEEFVLTYDVILNSLTYYIKPIKTYKFDTMHKSDIIYPKTILIRSFQSALLAIEPTSLYYSISKDSHLKLFFFIVFRWNANSWSYACMVCILGRNVAFALAISD